MEKKIPRDFGKTFDSGFFFKSWDNSNLMQINESKMPNRHV